MFENDLLQVGYRDSGARVIGRLDILSDDGVMLRVLAELPPGVADGFARRVVACVNAFRGVSPEELAEVAKEVEQRIDAKRQKAIRDELLSGIWIQSPKERGAVIVPDPSHEDATEHDDYGGRVIAETVSAAIMPTLCAVPYMVRILSALHIGLQDKTLTITSEPCSIDWREEIGAVIGKALPEN